MLNNKEYADLIKTIKQMSEEEFLDFIDSNEITDEDRQLIFDRFGRNKRKWWEKNKSLTAIAMRRFQSPETAKRETKRILNILYDVKFKMTRNLTDEKYPFDIWSLNLK